MAALVLLSGPFASEAKGTDAFTPNTPQQETSRTIRNKNLFSRGASNGGPGKPDEFGSGGDDGNDMPQYPKAESVQETENRLDKIDEYIATMDESSDSETEQCELDENVNDAKIEIVYRIKENPALVREAERAGRDQDAQRSLNNLVEQLSLGNRNPGIGTENVFKDIYELRGKNRARVYYREVDGKIEILAKSVKSNQQKVINILKKMYD